MKNPKENSLRWLRQAKFDLEEAKRTLDSKSFAYAAFFAEQSAQKSVKAFLIYGGKRFITTHSVGELLKEAALLESSFAPLVESGQKLDRHYLASRYPDALPEPAIPAESYVEDEAKDAIAIAEKIFNLCEKSIAGL